MKTDREMLMVVVHETAPSKQLSQFISVDFGERAARHDRRLRPQDLEENVG